MCIVQCFDDICFKIKRLWIRGVNCAGVTKKRQSSYGRLAGFIYKSASFISYLENDVFRIPFTQRTDCARKPPTAHVRHAIELPKIKLLKVLHLRWLARKHCPPECLPLSLVFPIQSTLGVV
jgi:hypothetical protein